MILERLWTTWQAVEDSDGTNRSQDKDGWKTFIDTMKETFRGVGMMVSTFSFPDGFFRRKTIAQLPFL